MRLWLCVDLGAGCFGGGDHGPLCGAGLVDLEHLKDDIRGLRDDTPPDDYRRIMAEVRANGCFYCLGDPGGCGLVTIR